MFTAPVRAAAPFNYGAFSSVAGSTTQPPLNFSSTAPQASIAPTTSAFSFGGGLSTTSSAAAAPAFSFGTAPASTTSTAPLNFGGGGITGLSSTVQPTTQLTDSTATVSPFSFGGGSVATLSSAVPSTTQSQPPAGVPATQPSGFSFSSGTTAAAEPNLTTTLTSSSSVVPTLAPSGGPGGDDAGATINFRQLQDLINKWTIEVEEQERDFIEQATKVNCWDKTLMSNADKISKLSEGMEKVKVEHVNLEHELDFLKNSQKDFEALIDSLEAALPKVHTPNSERVRMYRLTENMDTDLQQMSEDLKEIIRSINESNKLVDRTDPVSQVLRILNEHTDSLQWIEDHSNGLKGLLEDVSQMHQVFRRDHERSLKLMFKYN